MDNSILPFLFALVPLISPLLVFIASCLYIIKIVKADAILLCVGSGITLLISGMYILMPHIAQNRAMPVGEVSFYYSILGAIGLLGGLCFAAGLFLLINNMLNANKPLREKF